ncbi:MAG: PepSY domain-containing protein, partial [Phycisphaerae bacterium]
RLWGDLSQGLANLMPFVYRLHHSLALGTVGTWIFGVVALLWTLDCFVGAWLTFPPPRRRDATRMHGAASRMTRPLHSRSTMPDSVSRWGTHHASPSSAVHRIHPAISGFS